MYFSQRPCHELTIICNCCQRSPQTNPQRSSWFVTYSISKHHHAWTTHIEASVLISETSHMHGIQHCAEKPTSLQCTPHSIKKDMLQVYLMQIHSGQNYQLFCWYQISCYRTEGVRRKTGIVSIIFLGYSGNKNDTYLVSSVLTCLGCSEYVDFSFFEQHTNLPPMSPEQHSNTTTICRAASMRAASRPLWKHNSYNPGLLWEHNYYSSVLVWKHYCYNCELLWKHKCYIFGLPEAAQTI